MRSLTMLLVLALSGCVDAPFDVTLEVEQEPLSDAFPAGDIALVSRLLAEPTLVMSANAPESWGVGYARNRDNEHLEPALEMDVDLAALPEDVRARLGMTYEIQRGDATPCSAVVTGFVLAKPAGEQPVRGGYDLWDEGGAGLSDPDWMWEVLSSPVLLLATLDTTCHRNSAGAFAIAEGAPRGGIFFPVLHGLLPEENEDWSDDTRRVLRSALEVTRTRPAYREVIEMEEAHWSEQRAGNVEIIENLEDSLDTQWTLFEDRASGRRLLSIAYASGACGGSPNAYQVLFELEASPGGPYETSLLLRDETGSFTSDHHLVWFEAALDRDGDGRFSRIGWERFSSVDGEETRLDLPGWND